MNTYSKIIFFAATTLFANLAMSHDVEEWDSSYLNDIRDRKNYAEHLVGKYGDYQEACDVLEDYSRYVGYRYYSDHPGIHDFISYKNYICRRSEQIHYRWVSNENRKAYFYEKKAKTKCQSFLAAKRECATAGNHLQCIQAKFGNISYTSGFIQDHNNFEYYQTTCN